MHVDWRDIMSRTNYSREFRLMVAKEALLPENKDLEHVIADKYGIMPWTVIRWREHLAEVGEAEAFRYGFSKWDRRTDREKKLEKENAELREEIEILKKAAAFLASVKRD